MSAIFPHPAASELVERILSETPIGMMAAARLFGTFKSGKPVHPATVTRWASGGVLMGDGSRLRLDAVRVAGKLITSRAAVIRFIAAQQGTSTDMIQTPAALRQANHAADAILDAARI